MGNEVWKENGLWKKSGVRTNGLVLVKFKSHKDAEIFTMAVYELLITDDDTEWIVDAMTGEVIWSK